MATSKEVTDKFFEAVLIAIKSAAHQEGITLEDAVHAAVHSVFSIMDGVAGYCDLPPLDVEVDGVTIAEGDYIHEAWGQWLNNR